MEILFIGFPCTIYLKEIMGLITENIEVELSSSNMKHYQSIGYELPKVKRKNGKFVTPRGTKIIVKTNDLMCGSSEKVNVKCDCCNKVFSIYYYTYSYYNHDGLYYCNNCSSSVLESKEKSPRWINSISIEDRLNKRNSFEYSRFIHAVFVRDNYTCQCCNAKNVKLDVHHLNGYNWFIEGRTDVKNGITLCRKCHASFHAVYGRGNNTKLQFDEWIGYITNLSFQELYPSKRVYCIETQKIYNSSFDAAKDIGVKRGTMSGFCSSVKDLRNHHNTLKGLHFLWYDDYCEMTETEVKRFLTNHQNKHYRSVICITTGKIFNTIKEGADFYKIKSPVGITKCCNNKQRHCGKLDDETTLQWMYYETYKEKLKEG